MTRRDFMLRLMQLMAGVAAFRHTNMAFAAQPQVKLSDGMIMLHTDLLQATWKMGDGTIRPDSFKHVTIGGSHFLPQPFEIQLADGKSLTLASMIMESAPAQKTLAPNPKSPKAAERAGGTMVTSQWVSGDKQLRLVWDIIARPKTNYIRQQITLTALGQDVPIKRVVMIDGAIAGATVSGAVKGCPIVNEHCFYAFEHPLSEQHVNGGYAQAYLDRLLPLRAGQSVTYSSVIGIAHAGQMRRDFGKYIEQERARTYQPLLHYNTWYDIGFSDHPFTEQDALAVIAALTDKGLPIQSFLMDDGWDDPKTLWGFHNGFPKGFTKVAAAARKIGAAPGVWMSPWGGYGNEKAARMNFGKAQGFETNDAGFALSGPKYYQRFRDTCIDMIRKYGINQFKLDGMGNINSAFAGSNFDSDFAAAMSLISEIRKEKPDIYINLTFGTFPSPFWLQYADSIWRGGKDHDFSGKGSKRQQWINYRDADTYEQVVSKSPLFPLNSLMLHGIIFAQHVPDLKADPFGDFDGEVRSFFGSGTQLQELYVTPSLLQDRHWKTLKDASSFAQKHAATLRDTHWIGGNPNKDEVYGWAAWEETESIITLRNPSDKPQTVSLELAKILELPKEALSRFQVTSQWAPEAPPALFTADSATALSLKPFEVKTLVLKPQI